MSDLLERTVYMPGHAPITTRDYEPTEVDMAMMERALYMGDIALLNDTTPVGAVLLHNLSGTFWEATNREFVDDDLEGHPEKLAYKEAQPHVGRDLSSCSMYCVAEPCYGCTYTIDKGNCGTLYVAARRSDVDFFRIKMPDMDLCLKQSRRNFVVVHGLLAEAAKELLHPGNNVHHRVP